MAAIRCKAKKKSGDPCGAYALADSDYCYMHDPGRGHDRAAARKLGGLHRRTAHRGDPGNLPAKVRTLEDILQVLDYALAEILPLENSIARTRTLIALAAEYTNAIKTGELEARMLAIENALKARDEKR